MGLRNLRFRIAVEMQRIAMHVLPPHSYTVGACIDFETGLVAIADCSAIDREDVKKLVHKIVALDVRARTHRCGLPDGVVETVEARIKTFEQEHCGEAEAPPQRVPGSWQVLQ